MKRFIQLAGDVLESDAETVIEVKDQSLATLALELTLLISGMLNRLTLQFATGPKVALTIDAALSPGEKAWMNKAGNTIVVGLANNHVEYTQAVLLRAYRDQIAEVNHIHIEGERDQKPYDLTFLFETCAEPMSSDEAARLLDD